MLANGSAESNSSVELYDDLLSVLPRRIPTSSEHNNDFVDNTNQVQATKQHGASQSTYGNVVFRRAANIDQGEDNIYDHASSLQLQQRSKKTSGPLNQLASSLPPIPPHSEITTLRLVRSTSTPPPVPPHSSEVWLEQLPTSTEVHTATRDTAENYMPPVPLRRESLPSHQGLLQEGIGREVEKCHSSVPQSESKPRKKLGQTRARKTTSGAPCDPPHTASLYEDVLSTVQQSFTGKKRLSPQPYEVVVPKTHTQTNLFSQSHIK